MERDQLPTWISEGIGLNGRYAESTNYLVSRLHAGSAYTFAEPVCHSDGWLPAPFGHRSGRSPDVNLVTADSARMLTANLNNNTLMLQDGFVPTSRRQSALWAWDLAKNRQAVHLTGRTLLCVVEGSAVYSHWLLDTLPRIGALRQADIEPGDFDQIIVNTRQRAFHQESLSRLDLDADKVLTREKLGPLISCEHVSVVTEVRDAFVADPWLYDFTLNTWLASPGANSPQSRSAELKIYLSRASASRRRIVNEEELLPILERHGFQCLLAEDVTVAEMAQLASRATHFVGAHGAGIANIVFMPRQGRVMELYGAHLSSEYWRICDQRGLQYHLLQGRGPDGSRLDPQEVSVMPFMTRNGLDMYVPPVEFEEAMSRFVDC